MASRIESGRCSAASPLHARVPSFSGTARQMRRRILAILGAIALSACSRPGPREQGRAHAEWGVSESTRWSGTCLYSTRTRWATTLPHIVRLSADDSEWAIVLSARRRLSTGRLELSPTGERGVQGIVFEGGTVRGSVLGTLHVARRVDSTFIDLVGVLAYRDTVPLEATCRLGPIAAGSTAQTR